MMRISSPIFLPEVWARFASALAFSASRAKLSARFSASSFSCLTLASSASASLRIRMASSSSALVMSTTDFSSPFTSCFSAINSSRSESSKAKSAKALRVPRSVTVSLSLYPSAILISRCAVRTENSTFSSSQGFHSPCWSCAFASIRRRPISSMDALA